MELCSNMAGCVSLVSTMDSCKSSVYYQHRHYELVSPVGSSFYVRGRSPKLDLRSPRRALYMGKAPPSLRPCQAVEHLDQGTLGLFLNAQWMYQQPHDMMPLVVSWLRCCELWPTSALVFAPLCFPGLRQCCKAMQESLALRICGE